ncbi:MAG: alkaline phosphatase family protein [Acidobacteriota bacterium]
MRPARPVKLAAMHLACAVMLSSVLPAATPKIALVGLDGVDWKVVGPLMEAGRLPALASLRSQGVSGRVLASLPLLSPLIWTTIATGRTPDEHGVLDFVGFDEAGRQRPVSSCDRRCRALWNIFSERGRSVGVYGYWATWPAEPVNGEIASNLLFENLPKLHDLAAGTVSELSQPPAVAAASKERPAEAAELAALLGIPVDDCRRELARKTATPFESRVHHFARVVQSTCTLFDLSIARLRAKQPDLFMVYYEGTDIVAHLFHEQLAAPSESVLARYLQLIDSMLAQYRAAMSPDTILIVCSDHGFLLPGEEGGEGDPADFYTGASSYHRRYGIFFAAGPGIARGEADLSPLDFAPTILAAAGLPLPADMPGRVATVFGQNPVIEKIGTYETTPLVRTAPRSIPADESLENLKALGYIFSPSPTLNVNLGRVLLEKGDLAAAERVILRALETDPTRLSALYDLLDLRKRQGDNGGMLEAARRFAGAEGGMRADVAVPAVNAALAAGGPKEATALIEELFGRVQSPLRTLVTGMVQAAQNENAKAVQSMMSAVDAQQSLAGVALPEIAAAYRRWDPRAGLDALDRFKARPEVSVYRADLLVVMGRKQEALAAYESALAEFPDAPELMISAAKLRFATGDAAGARRMFERALDFDSGSDAALLGAGAAAAAAGDDTAAIHYIERSDYRTNPDALNALAVAYHRLGKEQQAGELLRASLRLRPDQPSIADLLRQIERNDPH